MTTTPAQAPVPAAATAPAAPQQSAAPEEDEQGGWGGRVLDGLGIVAGVVLVAIIVDIFTDGRLISRRLGRGPRDDDAQAEQAPEGEPA